MTTSTKLLMVMSLVLVSGCRREEDGAIGALGSLAANSAPVPAVTPTSTPAPTPTPTPTLTPEPTCRSGEAFRLEIRRADSLKEEREPVIHFEGRDEAEFALVVLDGCGAFLSEAAGGRSGKLDWTLHRARKTKLAPKRLGAEVRWEKGASAGVAFGKAAELVLVARADGRVHRADADGDAFDEAVEAELEERAAEIAEKQPPRRLRVARVRVAIDR